MHDSPLFRIAVLEKELAQALSEKVAAEHAAHYILKASASQWGGLSQGTGHAEDPGLEHDIRSLTSEVADLRKKLLDMASLLETALRAREAADLDKACHSYPSSTQDGAGTQQQVIKPINNSVDLLDLDVDADLERCRPPSSEDGLDELAQVLQLPPKIDFGSGNKESAQVAIGVDHQESLPHTGSPIIRRFGLSSTESSALSDRSLLKQDTPTPTSSFQSSPNSGRSNANGFIHRMPASRIYPNRPIERPPGRQPRSVGPRVRSWIEFSRETTAAYSEAGQATPSDSMIQPLVKGDTLNSNGENVVVLGHRYEPFDRANLNHTTFSNICGSEEIFESPAERMDAIMLHQRCTGHKETRFPDFFRFGIRYQPSPATQNTFQTLSFMNLPPSITLSELLSKIRGGTVVSCQLLNTSALTGSISALVRFMNESEAFAYDDFAAANPIVLHGRKICVSVVQTPSFPLSSGLMASIARDGRTRCLEIYNLPIRLTPNHFLRNLKISGMQANGIECMHMRKGRVLDLRFASIKHAALAYAKLVSYRSYRSCRIVWAKDPCALPLDTLKEVSMAGRSGIIQSEECVEENHVLVNLKNDNEIVTQHLNSPTRRKDSLSRSPRLKNSANSLLPSIPSIETSSKSESSTEPNISPERNQNMCFTSNWAFPDLTEIGSSQRVMASSELRDNQLSASMWAPSSMNETSAKQSSMMHPETNKKNLTSSIWASSEIKHAPAERSIEETHRLKPLSESIWAPFKFQVKMPTDKYPVNFSIEPSKNKLSSTLNASAQVFEPAEQQYVGTSTKAGLKTLSASIWASPQAIKPAAKTSSTFAPAQLNTQIEEHETSISDDSSYMETPTSPTRAAKPASLDLDHASSCPPPPNTPIVDNFPRMPRAVKLSIPALDGPVNFPEIMKLAAEVVSSIVARPVRKFRPEDYVHFSLWPKLGLGVRSADEIEEPATMHLAGDLVEETVSCSVKDVKDYTDDDDDDEQEIESPMMMPLTPLKANKHDSPAVKRALSAPVQEAASTNIDASDMKPAKRSASVPVQETEETASTSANTTEDTAAISAASSPDSKPHSIAKWAPLTPLKLATSSRATKRSKAKAVDRDENDLYPMTPITPTCLSPIFDTMQSKVQGVDRAENNLYPMTPIVSNYCDNIMDMDIDDLVSASEHSPSGSFAESMSFGEGYSPSTNFTASLSTSPSTMATSVHNLDNMDCEDEDIAEREIDTTHCGEHFMKVMSVDEYISTKGFWASVLVGGAKKDGTAEREGPYGELDLDLFDLGLE